jgi:hypothetical protein
MIFKIGEFRNAHEKLVHDTYEEKGIDSISLYCACNLCPVVAAYWFCREKDPSNTELTRRIESVKVFYGIVDIIE